MPTVVAAAPLALGASKALTGGVGHKRMPQWRAAEHRLLSPTLSRVNDTDQIPAARRRRRAAFEELGTEQYQGRKLRTIGERLNTTEETAKNTLFRATQKLRLCLTEMR